MFLDGEAWVLGALLFTARIMASETIAFSKLAEYTHNIVKFIIG